jgi:hypothetical protein
MGTRESSIEKLLIKEVKRLGGLCYKWTSPGRRGVPDRIVIYKGNTYFIETKTLDGDTSSAQLRESKRIFNQGQFVYFLEGHEQVKWFIKTLERLNVNNY